MLEKEQFEATLFYSSIAVIGLIAAIWFAIESGYTSSVLGTGLAAAYIGMSLIGVGMLSLYFSALGKSEGERKLPGIKWQLHSLWLGVIVASILGFLSKSFSFLSILSFPTQSVLTTAAEGLSQFNQILAITVMSPLNETFVFIAFALFAWFIVKMLRNLSKFSESTVKVLFFIIYLGFSTVFFFLFHVGLAGSFAFLISVFIYRLITGIFVFGDKLWNIIPYGVIVFSFEIGYHLANNISASVGWWEWFLLMTTHPIGLLVLGYFGLLFVAELFNVGRGLRS